MTTDHYLERHPYPGTGGDRPTPWEATYYCGGCGEELWTAEEGSGSTVGTPDEALQDHVDGLTREAEARHLNHEGWTCHSGGHEPGGFDRCADCREACIELADFLAAAGIEGLPQTPEPADDALTVTWHGPSRARPYPYRTEAA